MTDMEILWEKKKNHAKERMYAVAHEVAKDLPHFQTEIEDLIQEIEGYDEIGYYWMAIDNLYEFYTRED